MLSKAARTAARASRAPRAAGQHARALASGRFFTFEDVDTNRIDAAKKREEESVGLPSTGHSPVLDCVRASNETFSVVLDATLDEAAELMLVKKTSSLLVRDANGRVAGLVTERDFLKTHLKSVDGSTAVSVVMTPRSKIIMASPMSTLSECLELMLRKGIRNLPIFDPAFAKGKRVLGVVSIRALVRQIFLEQKGEISSLRDFISDSYSVSGGAEPRQ